MEATHEGVKPGSMAADRPRPPCDPRVPRIVLPVLLPGRLRKPLSP